MVKAFLLFVSVELNECWSWEICEVGVSGPPRSRSYQRSSAQPSPAQSVSGSQLGAAADEEQPITGMEMCQVGLDHQKWGTLVRIENVGGP